jgi:hypothetical protein
LFDFVPERLRESLIELNLFAHLPTKLAAC